MSRCRWQPAGLLLLLMLALGSLISGALVDRCDPAAPAAISQMQLQMPLELDPAEVAEYPVGTQPDALWHAPIAELGLHQSADGIVQYRAIAKSAAELKLDRSLVICRYSFGGDLTAVHLTKAGEAAQIVEGIPGFVDFANPLDVTQNPRTGFLYVADYGAKEIVLASQ